MRDDPRTHKLMEGFYILSKAAYEAAVEAAKKDPAYKDACDALDAALSTQKEAIAAKQETEQ